MSRIKNNQEINQEQIKEFASFAVAKYLEGGVSAGMSLVKDCYQDKDRRNFECFVYDQTLSIIDAEMSEYGNFKRQEFFEDEKFMSRHMGTSWINIKENQTILNEVIEIKKLISSNLFDISNAQLSINRVKPKEQP